MSSLVVEQKRLETVDAFSLPPLVARVLFLGILGACVAASFIGVPAPQAESAALTAGADLTNLLRFMAFLKGGMAALAAAAVFWRLGVGASMLRLSSYAIACGAMVSGPGLIWAMAHVGLGALLLHGGLLATGILLWRDPSVAVRLEGMIRARNGRRTASAARG